MKRKLVSKSEYARMKGVNPSTITRKVQLFGIPTYGGKLDPKEADRIIEVNSDPAYDSLRKKFGKRR